MTDYLTLKRAIGDVAFAWWAGLARPDKDGAWTAEADRASFAKLRRLGSLAESDLNEAIISALAEPAFFGRTQVGLGLLNRIAAIEGLARPDRARERAMIDLAPRVLVAAIVLADIRKNSRALRVGKELREAQSGEDGVRDSARARFLRLLRTDDPQDLLPQARRLSKVLDRKAPVGALGASLILWTDAALGRPIRKEWAIDFFSPSLRDQSESTQSEGTL